MPIQYAGVDLLLEDPEGGVCRWLNRYLAINGMDLYGGITSLAGLRHNSRSNVKQFTSLPVPNYPSQPPARINSLYWPTGASRWGHGLFLTDEEGLTQILAALTTLGGREEPALLRIFDQDVNPFLHHGTWMYLLPPRPVSAYDGGSAKNLWILPLVDERYWWQYRQFDGTVSTWEDLFLSIQSVLEIPDNLIEPLYDAIESEYGLPHCVEMKRKWDSAAMMLDAACHSVGKRFVLDTYYPTGENRHYGYIRGFANAETSLNTFLAAGAGTGIIAGGEFSSDTDKISRAEKVAIIFPDETGNAIGDVKTSALLGEVIGTFKMFHEAASTAVTSSTWRQELSDRVAADVDGWTSRLYDITYAGILDWRPNGFDDCIEWFVGERMRDGRYRVQTRVKSMPYNFGVENLCNQQNSNCPEPGEFGLAGIEIEAVYNGVATCKVLYRPCGVTVVPEEYNKRIQVYDELHQCLLNESETALIGRRGSASYMIADEDVEEYPECKWQMMSLCCPS